MTGRVGRLSKEKKRMFADLATARGRSRRGLFVLEGRRSILDALDHGVRFPYIVVREAAVDAATSEERFSESAVYHAADRDFDAIARTETPQAVIAIGELPDMSLDALPGEAPGLTLLADEVRDPGNLGTLLRTLAAVGGRVALLPRGNVDPYNPKAVRAAAGTTPRLSIATEMSRVEAIEWCAGRGLAILALDAGAPDLFSAPVPRPPVAVAVGNETAGLSDEMLDRAAAVVGVPMPGHVESLSVAIAGSIGLYAVGLRLRRECA